MYVPKPSCSQRSRQSALVTRLPHHSWDSSWWCSASNPKSTPGLIAALSNPAPYAMMVWCSIPRNGVSATPYLSARNG